MAETFSELQQRSDAAWEAWQRPERPRIDIALDTSTIAAGAGPVRDAIEAEARARNAAVDIGRTVAVGLQWLNPTVTISWPDGTRVVYGPVKPADAGRLLDEATGRVGAAAELAIGTLAGSRPGIPRIFDHPFFANEAERRLLARIGYTDPESIEHYVATGGYFAVNRMLSRHQTQEAIRQSMIDAGLTGRGGAYFPAGVKWNFLATAANPERFLVCNADEGDPGAWVNRIVLEGDPHLLLEGMIIAAAATGAKHGFIYIRAEYPLAQQRVQQAIDDATAAGFLGKGIFGTDMEITLEVIKGAGAYVCGEETGLISSVQDSRGMPRVKPPFPAAAGVYMKPTNVNNVETYCTAPLILRNGPEWYRQLGTERNSGTKIFSFSGDIERVGFTEVPWGVPLRNVLDACGGIDGGGTLKSIQAGGPLAGYLPAHLLDTLTLERETWMPYGALLGSGGIVFISERTCSVDLNAVFADFLEDESCGRCTTCHGGNQRMTEIFRRTQQGGGRREDRHNLELLGSTLIYSNCVHGQASPTIMRNTLRFFSDEYEEHVHGAKCDALRCVAFTRYRVADQSDPRLAEAQAICPAAAIEMTDGEYRVLDGACVRCGACAEVAPRGIVREAAPLGTAQPAAAPYGAPGHRQR
ncbi:MAG: NADH-ubiquinone oxidoreductase-F iron-sulfur binding region domain-containing protein [Dehalococcoidia bacterium]